MKARNKPREKLAAAIAYFSSKVKFPSTIKIFKLLYFLDFIHFHEVGTPVTYLDYYAWKFGPVPKDLWIAIKNDSVPGDFRKFFSIAVTTKGYNDQEKRLFKSSGTVDLSVFSPRQVKIMDRLIDIYIEATPSDMVEATHMKKHPWEVTLAGKGENQRIDYAIACDSSSVLTKEAGKIAEKEWIEWNRYCGIKPI
jgi:uncharacterized phage-associated protein